MSGVSKPPASTHSQWLSAPREIVCTLAFLHKENPLWCTSHVSMLFWVEHSLTGGARDRFVPSEEQPISIIYRYILAPKLVYFAPSVSCVFSITVLNTAQN